VLNVIDVRGRSYQYYYYPRRDAAGEHGPKPPRPKGGLEQPTGGAAEARTG
jgi:hypothetical protein